MQLFLGTGLAFGRPRRPGPAGPGAPALVRAPGLIGTGRIGETLAIDPGDWTGAERLAFAWLKDGAPVPGAEGPSYAPTAADDRAGLACRVTAFGSGGRSTAQTPEITIIFPKPQLVGPLPHLDYTQGTGPHIVDVSSFFSGNSLRFSITGDGVAVDPTTGIVTIDAEALLSGVSVQVTASNSGGAAESSFRLTVAAEAPTEPVVVAPVALAPPAPVVLAKGAGTKTVAAAAFFSGTGLAFALVAPPAGVSIDAGSGVVTIPTAAPLKATLSIRASNAAGAATQTLVVNVSAAPVALAAPAPVVFAQEAGSRTISAQAYFAGPDLVYGLDAAPAGVTINPGSGLLRIPTAAALTTTLALRATNAAGAATQALALSVRTTAPATPAAPPAAANGDWTLDQILVLK